ncbi:hypothetical protein MHYP_G00266380 [Metynnis hypsauchen]
MREALTAQSQCGSIQKLVVQQPRSLLHLSQLWFGVMRQIAALLLQLQHSNSQGPSNLYIYDDHTPHSTPELMTEIDGDITAITDALKHHCLTQASVTMVTDYYWQICTAWSSTGGSRG